MDEEKEYPIIRERVWISKEEAKKLFPSNETKIYFGATAEIRKMDFVILMTALLLILRNQLIVINV